MEKHSVINIDQLPVEILEHIFMYLPLCDRKNIRLASKSFHGICNLPKFLEKEKLVCRKEFDKNIQKALLKTYRSILHLQLVNVNVKIIPKKFWKKIGNRICSLTITQDNQDNPDLHEKYSREVDNAVVKNLLFHCKNSNFFIFDLILNDPDGRILGISPSGPNRRFKRLKKEEYSLLLVSDTWSGEESTIRPLKQCSCSSTKEIYTSTYNTEGRVDLETIFLNIEWEEQRDLSLLDRINHMDRYTRGISNDLESMKYLGIRVCYDFDKLTTLKRIVYAQKSLRGLLVRFNSMEETDSSMRSFSVDSPLYSYALEYLQHLTIYGGCRRALKIFENFDLTSLKHLDIYASDAPSVTEPDEQSSIELVLNHIVRSLPSLQVLRVDNLSEWVKVKTSLGKKMSSFRIKNKDKDVCGRDECCKLSSVRHRFNMQNYRLKRSEKVALVRDEEISQLFASFFKTKYEKTYFKFKTEKGRGTRLVQIPKPKPHWWRFIYPGYHACGPDSLQE